MWFINRIRKSDVSFLLIGSYLIMATYLVVPDIGMYDSKRVLQLLLFFGLANYFIYEAFSDHSSIHFPKKILIPISLIFVTGLISALISEFHRFAIVELLTFAIITLSIAQLTKNTKRAHYRLGRFIYLISIVFSAVYFIYFLGNYISAHMNILVPMWPDRLAVAINIGDTVYEGREVLNFAHKRFFNHLQTWTLPVLVSAFLYFKSESIYWKLLGLLLIGWWSLVFASGARGTIVAVIIATFIIAFFFRRKSLRYVTATIGTAVLGFILYYLLFNLFVPNESLPVVRMTDSGRLEMWGKALEMWQDAPFLGVGPMHYAVIKEIPYFAHPHNFYLQILSEWGTIVFIGALSLPVLFFYFIKKNFLTNNFRFKEFGRENNIVYMGLLGSSLAGFSHAGVSGVFHTPMSQIFLIITLSWLISLWVRYSNSELIVNRKIFSAFYIIVLSVLFIYISTDLNDMNNKKYYKEKYNQSKLYPRYWNQGLIDTTINDNKNEK